MKKKEVKPPSYFVGTRVWVVEFYRGDVVTFYSSLWAWQARLNLWGWKCCRKKVLEPMRFAHGRIGFLISCMPRSSHLWHSLFVMLSLGSATAQLRVRRTILKLISSLSRTIFCAYEHVHSRYASVCMHADSRLPREGWKSPTWLLLVIFLLSTLKESNNCDLVVTTHRWSHRSYKQRRRKF